MKSAAYANALVEPRTLSTNIFGVSAFLFCWKKGNLFNRDADAFTAAGRKK